MFCASPRWSDEGGGGKAWVSQAVVMSITPLCGAYSGANLSSLHMQIHLHMRQIKCPLLHKERQENCRYSTASFILAQHQV